MLVSTALVVSVSITSTAVGAVSSVCPENSYTLRTQSQVDGFPAGCTTISGNLEIIDSEDVADLSPLSAITSIGGALEITGNKALVYTDGLAHLSYVGGEIRISDNPFLVNIMGLWNLTSVNDLYLEDNPRLDKVDGLYHVAEATGDVVVARNERVLHLYGLWNLLAVGGDLIVSENQSMINVDALFHVESVGGSLAVSGNEQLVACGGGLYSLVKGGGVSVAVTMTGNAAAGDCNNNGANLVPAVNIHSSSPAPTSPPNGGNAEVVPFVELLWRRLDGAERYDVQVALDNSFTKIVWHDNVPNVRSKLREAVVGQKYYWRARALSQDFTTAWGQAWSFTAALSRPDTSALIAPIEGAIGVSVNPVFKWVDTDSTFQYQLQVASDGAFSNLVVDHSGRSVAIDSLESSLNNGTDYYWRVRPRNASGDGPWSDIRSFRTVVPAPDGVTLVYPDNGAIDVSVNPVFRWLGTDSAVLYQLEVAIDSAFAVLAANDSALSVAFDSLGASLARETGYYWRVRGHNDGGDGPWSAVRTFRTELGTPRSVTLVSPENGVTGVPPYLTLSWLPVEEVAGYDLQIATNPSFTAPVVDESLLPDSSITLTEPLSYHTAFYWRVRAGRDDGTGKSAAVIYGPWSETRSFTVAIGTGIEDEARIPTKFALRQNYPNPFNPDRVGTTIGFDLPGATTVRMVIFDALGRAVESIVDGQFPAGTHKVVWDAKGVPSGVYFVRLKAGPHLATSRILLSK